jgi:hypothetical protein
MSSRYSPTGEKESISWSAMLTLPRMAINRLLKRAHSPPEPEAFELLVC